MRFCNITWRNFASTSQSRGYTAQIGDTYLQTWHCNCAVGAEVCVLLFSSDNTTVAFNVSGKYTKVQLFIHTMQVHTGGRYIYPLIFYLDYRWRRVVRLALPGRFTTGKKNCYWIWDWVGPRGGLGVLEKRKISHPYPVPTLWSCRLYRLSRGGLAFSIIILWLSLQL